MSSAGVTRLLLKALVVVVLLFALLGAGSYWWYSRALQQPLQVSQAFILEVPAGSTPGGMLDRMERQGLLHSAFLLRLHWRLHFTGKSLHSGEYRLTPGMSMERLFEVWSRGEVVQYRVALIEGWTFRQVRELLSRQEKLRQTLEGVSDQDLMRKLGRSDQAPEGLFFPDTYLYTKGHSDLEILRQALRKMDRILDEEWRNRQQDLPYKTPYEALIMASIVEKETGVAEERAQISGVFFRRLRQGMPLQTDPTVIYGMGERYNGRITRADLKKPTAYNTYVINVLPPTPIALAGREAIHATLHPAEGSALYFVARGDGSHVFSDTLAEHNRAVQQYQRNRRSDYRSSPNPTTPEANP